MDDAQRRAEQFNTEQRITELEAEIRRLRRALRQQKPADDDVHALVRGLKALAEGRITVVPPKKKPKRKP